MSSVYINDVERHWRKCIRKLLNLPMTTHCALIPLICNDKQFRTQLHIISSKLLFSLINSENECIKLCAKIALYGDSSATSMNMTTFADAV